MIFHYPNHMPLYNEGMQIHNPGTGGPSGNLAAMQAHPHPWPEMVGHKNGFVQGPVRFIGRPQMPVNNNLAVPSMFVEIPGLMKAPTYG